MPSPASTTGGIGDNDRLPCPGWYDEGMPPSDPTESHEAPRDPIEIRQEDAITIQEALAIATEQDFPIGKSTLQRWAKAWDDRNESSVKCVLVTTRKGKTYHLHRDDFKAWVFDQKQNMRPNEAPRDPVTPHETSKDFTRSHQTSRDSQRPRETSSDADDIVQELREENMQLKIDVGVRKQLLNQAAGEIGRQRGQIETLLRENGALESRVLQLSSASNLDRAELAPPTSHHAESDHVVRDALFDIDSPAGPDTDGNMTISTVDN
jgi:hypothetical protein